MRHWMTTRCGLTVLVYFVCSGFVAFAGPVDEEVSKLAHDAKAILAEHSNAPVTPARYAQCIFNLERAQSMLEGAGDSTSVLAQEVNSTLFWAKRFSTLEISNELGKIRKGGGGAVAVESARPPKPVSVPIKPANAAPAPTATGAMLPEGTKLAAAKAGFHQAELFAKSRKGDPFAVALRWFQVASNFSGTEYALKALERAQEANARAASGKSASAAVGGNPREPSKRALMEADELKAATPEIKLLRDGEKAAENQQFAEAINHFKSSIKIKDTISAQSRLGYTYFKLAQSLQEKLLPQYKEVDDEYVQAFNGAYRNAGGFKYFDDRSPALVNVKRKIELMRKESDQIVINYVNAQACFERILKLVPEGKDFDAAAYAGISMAKRNEAKFRAKTYIAEFLKTYKPADVGEQITYEYCKSELERINK